MEVQDQNEILNESANWEERAIQESRSGSVKGVADFMATLLMMGAVTNYGVNPIFGILSGAITAIRTLDESNKNKFHNWSDYLNLFVTTVVIFGYIGYDILTKPEEIKDNSFNPVGALTDFNTMKMQTNPAVGSFPVIDGNDIFFGTSAEETSDIVPILEQPGLKGVLFSGKNSSSDGYLIFDLVKPTNDEDGYLGIKPQGDISSDTFNISADLVASVKKGNADYMLFSGQGFQISNFGDFWGTNIPRTFYDSTNNEFYNIDAIRVRDSSNNIVDTAQYRIRSSTSGAYFLEYIGDQTVDNISADIVFLKNNNPMNVAGNVFQFDNSDSPKGLDVLLNAYSGPMPYVLTELVRIFSLNIEYSTRPFADESLMDESLTTFADRIILEFVEAMCSYGNASFGVLVSEMYEQGLLDPTKKEDMFALALGYLMFANDQNEAILTKENYHMFGMGYDSILDATPSNGSSTDPITEEYLRNLGLAMSLSSKDLDIPLDLFDLANIKALGKNSPFMNGLERTREIIGYDVADGEKTNAIAALMSLAVALGITGSIFKRFSSAPFSYLKIEPTNIEEKLLLSLVIQKIIYAPNSQELTIKEAELEGAKTNIIDSPTIFPIRKLKAIERKHGKRIKAIFQDYRSKIDKINNES